MNKILFVDVDGVLNCWKDRRDGGIHTICTIKVGFLGEIIHATNAQIILSSTWRILESNHKRVQEAFDKHNLQIFDVTPRLNSDYRYSEIQESLHKHKPDRFAILDDWDDAAKHEWRDSFFQTDDDIGLTQEIASKVIRCLNE